MTKRGRLFVWHVISDSNIGRRLHITVCIGIQNGSYTEYSYNGGASRECMQNMIVSCDDLRCSVQCS